MIKTVDFSKTAPEEDDVALIAVPSYGGRCPGRTFNCTENRSRPDAEDERSLKEMAVQIRKKLIDGENSLPHVPGKVPDKPGLRTPGMGPDASDACVKCGLCAAKCPVGVIDLVTMNPDSKKCISCMRCISICPVGAKKLGRVITSLGGLALGALCTNRKECELFL